MGTINSQGLEWCRLCHRDKLRQVLELFRVQQLDILAISEMHNSEIEKASFERVYIEETLCIFGSKVGVMLSLAALRAYEAANSRTKVLEGRYLAVHLRWSSRDDTGSVALVAIYFLTTVTATERDANYMCALKTLSVSQQADGRNSGWQSGIGTCTPVSTRPQISNNEGPMGWQCLRQWRAKIG